MKAHAPDDATATSTSASASGLEVSGIAASQTPRPTSSASRLARLRRHQAKIRQCAQELGVSLDQPTSNNAPRDTKKATGAEGADDAMPSRHESAVPVVAPEIISGSASTPPSAATRGTGGQGRMQEQVPLSFIWVDLLDHYFLKQAVSSPSVEDIYA